MKSILKGATAGLALVSMVGHAWAAGACARPQEAMALKTAAMQQELMVAALYCNDVSQYNHFVVSFQRELQASDAALMRFFQHGHGGASAYHAYKTALANDFSLSSLHGMVEFCSMANAHFDASNGQQTLALFISSQSVRGAEAYQPCDRTVAGAEAIAGRSARVASNRRN
ncbi:MAG TPA: hypothetical protein VG819_14025 [Rhizomicrobium sp.]|jgi:hypothetical protein|nr:hypothetical protein [Rhizomicrobium sp.]